MKTPTLLGTTQPDTATGNELAVNGGIPRLVGKRVVAAANSVSVRTVDNWNRDGCPHIKISSRMARYDLFEVNAWLKSRFGSRRLG